VTAQEPDQRLPAENSIVTVGVLGAVIFAALAVIVRTPGYVLYPQTYETAYFWPFATHALYLDFLVAELGASGVLCAATCVGWVLARSRARGADRGALLGGRIYTLVGISLAAFVSSTYFAIAPVNIAVGLAATVASALFAWLALRQDWKSQRSK